ncbi:MAG: DUF998 domain-containing protein [Pseudonocardiaceae bacterium]
MRTVPWWAALSSSCAPVLLIGGWQLAASRQPGVFDPVSQTISALAARGATDRWIMSTALAGVGVCHVITAAGLAPMAAPARLLLATGGVATAMLTVLPLPVTGDSPAHVAAASVAFSTLSLWPAFAGRGTQPGRDAQPGRGVWPWAAAVLLGLLGWFGLEYFAHGPRLGLSERVLAAAQALCPLAAALLARRR